MKQSEITGRISAKASVVIAAENDQDAGAADAIADALVDFVELLAIERVRDRVIHGHHNGKTTADHVIRLSEKVGDIAAAYGEFRDGEAKAFEELQIGLIDLGMATTVLFERIRRDPRIQPPHPQIQSTHPEVPAVWHVLQEVADTKPIIAFTGARGAGKDSVAKHLIEQYGYEKGSFAAPLKFLVATEYGFDLTRLDELEYKEEFVPELGMTRREVLILVGTKWFRSIDPLHWIKRSRSDFHNKLSLDETTGLVVTDLRFENELSELRRLFPRNPLVVVRVVRTDAPTEPNADDAINAWRSIPWDVELRAAYGQLPLLYSQMDKFMCLFNPGGTA